MQLNVTQNGRYVITQALAGSYTIPLQKVYLCSATFEPSVASDLPAGSTIIEQQIISATVLPDNNVLEIEIIVNNTTSGSYIIKNLTLSCLFQGQEQNFAVSNNNSGLFTLNADSTTVINIVLQIEGDSSAAIEITDNIQYPLATTVAQGTVMLATAEDITNKNATRNGKPLVVSPAQISNVDFSAEINYGGFDSSEFVLDGEYPPWGNSYTGKTTYDIAPFTTIYVYWCATEGGSYEQIEINADQWWIDSGGAFAGFNIYNDNPFSCWYNTNAKKFQFFDPGEGANLPYQVYITYVSGSTQIPLIESQLVSFLGEYHVYISPELVLINNPSQQTRITATGIEIKANDSSGNSSILNRNSATIAGREYNAPSDTSNPGMVLTTSASGGTIATSPSAYDTATYNGTSYPVTLNASQIQDMITASTPMSPVIVDAWMGKIDVTQDAQDVLDASINLEPAISSSNITCDNTEKQFDFSTYKTIPSYDGYVTHSIYEWQFSPNTNGTPSLIKCTENPEMPYSQLREYGIPATGAGSETFFVKVIQYAIAIQPQS